MCFDLKFVSIWSRESGVGSGEEVRRGRGEEVRRRGGEEEMGNFKSCQKSQIFFCLFTFALCLVLDTVLNETTPHDLG